MSKDKHTSRQGAMIMRSGPNGSCPRWLSVDEVADEIGCHSNTVWNLIRSGELPAVRFGARLVRVERESLDRLAVDYHVGEVSAWLQSAKARW
jgi:excisionase family DNA binding protein